MALASYIELSYNVEIDFQYINSLEVLLTSNI